MLQRWKAVSASGNGVVDESARDGMVHRFVDFLRSRAQPQTRLLRQVESLQLGSKRTVYVIECDGDRFLIAAGGDSVSAPVALKKLTVKPDDAHQGRLPL